MTSPLWTDYFYYDESSPTRLRWKIEVRCGKNLNRVQRQVGDVAGSMSGKYVTVCIADTHY